MDLTPSLVPNSAQVNADDLIAGPITVTISEVSKGNAEQPFFFNLVEIPDRSYRPSKSMRRMIVQCWGSEAANYSGRQLTLYRNPDITFGKDRVGGIEISHASHIAGPVTLALTVSRGKRKDFTVQPLPAAHPALVQDPVLVDEWISTIRDTNTVHQLEAAWHGINAAGIAKDPRVIAAKNKRKTELT